MNQRVAIYDTTLRDGAQREGISFSLEDKLKIVRKLSELGVHYVEGGWPGSNPKDQEFFERVRDIDYGPLKMAGFGRTCSPGCLANEDANLLALVQSGVRVATLVGKSWDFQVLRVLGTELEENLRMIRDSIAFCKSVGLEAIFDAEHFFDGYRENRDYAISTVEIAAEAGADVVVLCDTNGGRLPDEISDAVMNVIRRCGVKIGIHAHNDSELAVANTLAAVRAGAVHVQGTINGFGERCGNANLGSILPNLKLKMGIDCITDEQLARLTEVAHYVSEVANLAPDAHMPYVGVSAFAHKGGMHVDAVRKHSKAYEHVTPGLVGNEQRVVVSELGGKSNVLYKAQQLGLDLNDHRANVRDLVVQIKDLESKGFQFEDADASFELLIMRTHPNYRAPFELLDFLVLAEKRQGIDIVAEATVKVRVQGTVMHTAAEGNGPVNALDQAMRKALLPFYPGLGNIELLDYKVRVLEDVLGTASVVRVYIESGDGEHTWSTVGSSPNIIEASWRALADSLEYPLVKWPERMPVFSGDSIDRNFLTTPGHK